ncbi:unnamed protein product [Ilex paraguariensis]|uniref:Uncharacterized protein n=1 Tax=Ilex paraguariensis TaxID=185542 RepID=A0ABC8RXU2_9AQUA
MVMEDNESSSCGSRAAESTPVSRRQQRNKLEVCNEVLHRLQDSNNQASLSITVMEDNESSSCSSRAVESTLVSNRQQKKKLEVYNEGGRRSHTHKWLLYLAHDPANRPAFEVRLVQVPPISDGNSAESVHSNLPGREGDRSKMITEIIDSSFPPYVSIHPPLVFGSSPNLKALALEANKSQDQDGDNVVNASVKSSWLMHEITFSTDDKPKLLSEPPVRLDWKTSKSITVLTSLIYEIGLNIQEAHAFSTVDGNS